MNRPSHPQKNSRASEDPATDLLLPVLHLRSNHEAANTAKTSSYSQEITNSSKNGDEVTPITSSEIASRLQQILESLLRQRSQFERKWRIERQSSDLELKKREETIESLVAENRILKKELHSLRMQLSQKQECISTLIFEKRHLQAERESLKSIVSYLQTKNQEMTYDLFQMKNSLRAKSRMNTEQKGLLHESGSHRMPKYLLEQLDQQSIYEYTGNITGQISHDLKRVESQPTIEILSDLAQHKRSVGKVTDISTQKKSEKRNSGKNSCSKQMEIYCSKRGTLNKKASVSRKQLCRVQRQPKRKVEKGGDKESKQVQRKR